MLLCLDYHLWHLWTWLSHFRYFDYYALLPSFLILIILNKVPKCCWWLRKAEYNKRMILCHLGYVQFFSFLYFLFLLYFFYFCSRSNKYYSQIVVYIVTYFIMFVLSCTIVFFEVLGSIFTILLCFYIEWFQMFVTFLILFSHRKPLLRKSTSSAYFVCSMGSG